MCHPQHYTLLPSPTCDWSIMFPKPQKNISVTSPDHIVDPMGNQQTWEVSLWPPTRSCRTSSNWPLSTALLQSLAAICSTAPQVLIPFQTSSWESVQQSFRSERRKTFANSADFARKQSKFPSLQGWNWDRVRVTNPSNASDADGTDSADKISVWGFKRGRQDFFF